MGRATIVLAINLQHISGVERLAAPQMAPMLTNERSLKRCQPSKVSTAALLSYASQNRNLFFS